MRNNNNLLSSILFIISIFLISVMAIEVPLFSVHEIQFSGPNYSPKDKPAEEVELYCEWHHEDGGPVYRIFGFWDGDGKGGGSGNVFKVRFCPVKEGKWILGNTFSNKNELNDQNEGYTISATSSDNPGFWEVDFDYGNGRWYKRTSGIFQYIIGNTMYSFLSEMNHDGPNGSNIRQDIQNNALYFKKVRFSIMGDRYPHPKDKPFFNNDGKPSDDGNFSFRPNPSWFFKRVDLAVQTALKSDLITDLILNGPDTEDSRSALVSAENGGDCTPYLRYLAARYGSYPNVWICLANEWNIKNPKYKATEVNRFGHIINKYLPYPTPVSIHAAPTDWYNELNTIIPWNDHIILQYKIKRMQISTDFIEKNYWIGSGNKPVINDELAYEGQGDQWTEQDVIEAHLGAFMGGGYGSTGFKHPISKQGHYFWGAFNVTEHTSADNLKWMRDIIDKNILFWKMVPNTQIRFNNHNQSISIFRNVQENFRVLEWPGNDYILGTNQAHQKIEARLPKGIWQIRQFDIITKEEKLLSANASATFVFDSPDSRAVLFQVKKISD